jgi:hypothetical protein
MSGSEFGDKRVTNLLSKIAIAAPQVAIVLSQCGGEQVSR